MRTRKTASRQTLIHVVLFAVITYGFHLIWKVFQQPIESAGFMVVLGDWFATRAYLAAMWVNEVLLGMDVVAAPNNVVYFANERSMIINESCSGLKQFYQVLVLFILFPGPWRHKIWFIPLGLFVMHLTNVFRVVALSIAMAQVPQHWHFIHDWVLRPFFYVILFGLWVIWVEVFVAKRRRVRR